LKSPLLVRFQPLRARNFGLDLIVVCDDRHTGTIDKLAAHLLNVMNANASEFEAIQREREEEL
jgi:hypothetical protein